MSFVLGRVKAIAIKEVYHILRDPFTLALSLGIPIFLVFIFGFAIEFNVKNIHVAAFDADQTQASRRLKETFASSGYFIVDSVHSPQAAQTAVENEKDRAALIIPGGFEKNIHSEAPSEVQLLLDGSDNSTVSPILSYLSSMESIANQRIARFEPKNSMNIVTRFLFNEELNSRWFVIPGLIVVVMAILSVLLTALTVSREWEHGSMELLLSTPVQPIEIIAGKLIPYAVLGLGAFTFVYLMSRFLFEVPFRGSLISLVLASILFLIAYLSQGLLISVVLRTQLLSMQLAIISGLLPAQLLSGFIFPIESMPTFFRYFTMILPARWFMTISRYLYLRGASFFELIGEFTALAALGFFMIWLAVKKFKRDLEP